MMLIEPKADKLTDPPV